MKKEVAFLKKARHPHVMSLLEVINDPEFGKIYLILKYIELGKIIWRTRADDNIVVFERNLVRPKIAGNTVVAMEEEKIEAFNQDREVRRAKQSTRLREGHQRADQQNSGEHGLANTRQPSTHRSGLDTIMESRIRWRY